MGGAASAGSRPSRPSDIESCEEVEIPSDTEACEKVEIEKVEIVCSLAEMCDHPNEHSEGVVVFVDARAALEGRLATTIAEVAQHRGVLYYEDAVAAQRALDVLEDGSVVCVVAARQPAIALSAYVRDASRTPVLRTIPLVVLTRDSKAALPAAKVGSVVESNLGRLASRILSLPSKAVLRSEPGAALFKGLMTDVRFGHFEREGVEKDWVFSDNRQYLLQGMHRSRMEWYPRCDRYDEHISEVASYVQGLQPVHRCKPGVLLAILREGGLVSRTELDSLLNGESGSSPAVRRTARHIRLQELTANAPFQRYRRDVFKYAEAKCLLRESQCPRVRVGVRVAHEGRTGIVTFGPDSDNDCKVKYDDDGSESSYICADNLEKLVDEAAVQCAEKAINKAKPSLSEDDMATLDAVVDEVVEDVLALVGGKLTGIGYAKDKELGTNRHVFATLGLNRQFEYGSVVIFLNRNLLHHPDTWVSPLAATGFLGPYYWAFRHRPWSGAGLLELAAKCDPGDGGYPKVADTPENDDKGVVACIHSSINMAAVEGWPYIAAREIDGMCHYLSFNHRDAYAFDSAASNCGLNWLDETLRQKSRQSLLNEEGDRILPDAWKTVVQYYESKNSHTLYECHLPSFIPLGAIDRICISSDLYKKHSEVQAKVETFVLPDGRRLKDLIEITETRQRCMQWQEQYFDQQRRKHLSRAISADGSIERVPPDRAPVSVYLAGQSGRPVFLPPDFGAWFVDSSDKYHAWKETRACRLHVSFCSRAWHDIRVFFSSTAEPQRAEANLKDDRWRSTTYQVCIGAKGNKSSYITKGILGTRHAVHVENDLLVRCVGSGEGSEGSFGVWERYWFQVQVSAGRAVVSCGRGPIGENVMMRFEDDEPIRDLKYVGLGCWNEPTVYCDVRAYDFTGS